MLTMAEGRQAATAAGPANNSKKKKNATTSTSIASCNAKAALRLLYNCNIATKRPIFTQMSVIIIFSKTLEPEKILF